ncbi:LAME_0H06942g1_1 [Lachancea meyersii CBS 8951]|uniref:LAME_0H06942g1_1 n=1 Tax=Lachancea meyersii CBS 8951 TaxID=1266667 RepID=A0A1G4KEW3_9SACH|nr:LAME_0H06942g1_1 [Lachancea meyersii CBS 8951]
MLAVRTWGARALRVSPRRFKTYATNVQSLEDLAKLNSLDDVDPELVRRLINERTNQLNTQNELDMLKQMQTEEKQGQQMALKKFVRPMWIFLLMSSFFYLGGHYIWWKLEYDEREIELNKQVQDLRMELDEAIELKKIPWLPQIKALKVARQRLLKNGTMHGSGSDCLVHTCVLNQNYLNERMYVKTVYFTITARCLKFTILQQYAFPMLRRQFVDLQNSVAAC